MYLYNKGVPLFAMKVERKGALLVIRMGLRGVYVILVFCTILVVSWGYLVFFVLGCFRVVDGKKSLFFVATQYGKQ